MEMEIHGMFYLPLLIEFERCMQEIAKQMPDIEENEGAFLSLDIDFQTPVSNALCVLSASKHYGSDGHRRVDMILLEAGTYENHRNVAIVLTTRVPDTVEDSEQVVAGEADAPNRGEAKDPENYFRDLAQVLARHCAGVFLADGTLPDTVVLQERLSALTDFDVRKKNEEGRKRAGEELEQMERHRRMTHLPPARKLQ